MRTPYLPSLLLALTAWTALGCGDDAGMPSFTSGLGNNDATGADGTTAGNDSMTGMLPGDSGADAPTGGEPTVGTNDAGDAPPGCPNAPQADGAMCSEDCECASDKCFFIPGLGGVCGECKADADCPDGGCTIPNPLSTPPTGSVCNDGSAGTGCETTAVCQDGLTCGTLVEVPGIFTLSTCGECLADADCGGQLCSPSIDLAMFTGEKTCVALGSVPNGQICDHLGTGDMACTSGICATVDIMAVVQVGVCGECEVAADCTDPTATCEPASIDTTTQMVIPPTCVPA